MKKLAGILLLTAAVILTAGCVSTQDPIVGTWEVPEPIDVGDYTYTHTLTFSEDGNGQSIYSFSDEPRERISPLIWEKTGEDTYWYEYFECLTISEDKKIATDIGGYKFALGKDEEIIGGMWTEVEWDELGYRGIYVFNEDGSCIMTRFSKTEEPVEYKYRWKMINWNQISLYAYYYPYTITEDGIMIVNDGVDISLEEIDGTWIETPIYGETRSELQILEDETIIMTNYIGDTDEIYSEYQCFLDADEDKKNGFIVEKYGYYVTIDEEGMLVDIWFGEVLEKVTA